MALKTQGFQLSALPKAPSIPKNVGVVDVSAIDKGVRDRLATFEMVRQMPGKMALADVQNEAALQDVRNKSMILASEASPEMQEAKRTALANRNVKQTSGAIQVASALAAAKQRLAEDPSDAQAGQLVAILEPMAIKLSAATMADPQAAIEQRASAVDANNATRIATNAASNVSREGIAEGNQALGRDRLAADTTLRREGFGSAQEVARIGAQGRIDAAKAANINKAYEAQAQRNVGLREELAALELIDSKVDQLKGTFLGSGPIVGSSPVVAARAIFGDTAGKELTAATAQAMQSAVQSMRGLGAMSNIEFDAIMNQLPRPNDPAEALDTKMDFMKAVRPWMLARSDMYLDELAKGISPIQANQNVMKAFPMPSVAGAAQLAASATPAAAAQPVAPPATNIDALLDKYK